MVVVVLMGVCGSGKSTVGKALAAKMHCVFRDADEFHSSENKLKMSSGIPLTDEDRVPWLLAIHDFIKSLQDSSETGVVTCSALKRWYRDILRSGRSDKESEKQPSNDSNTAHQESFASADQASSKIVFVLLHGSRDLLAERMAARKGHFMPSTLLSSQLEILDVPGEDEDSFTVDIQASISGIVDTVINRLSLVH
ncbi:probable gluconokinase [Pomacea canaliculata]|uniref:probable gluconokinase n=1 Tax=Pomacea canaliculata TaxID=400727 RepID=UPI000D72BDE7|nr:probable gluconokinase [Pomacea canaliculata]XP_025077202.1 probable gluconokinase [Pomacea canaliculata]